MNPARSRTRLLIVAVTRQLPQVGVVLRGTFVQKLIDGIHQFQLGTFLPLQGLFEQLAKGQHPETLFITCSDSRIDPTLLMNAKPGDLFILRNAGNIIPPPGAGNGGEAATIEFAV